jgi:hypothetical protein
MDNPLVTANSGEKDATQEQVKKVQLTDIPLEKPFAGGSIAAMKKQNPFILGMK